MRIERLQVVESHRLDGNLHDVLFRNARRTLLLLQEVFTGIDERLLRNETNDFRSGHPHTTGCSSTAHLVEGYMQGCHVEIGHVHRHLGNTIFIDKPANGLRGLQRTRLHNGLAISILQGLSSKESTFTNRTAFFAHIEGDGVGTTGAGGVQVIVHGNEEVAGTHGRTTRAGHTFVEGACTKVGSLLGHSKLFGQSLILACTANSQILSLRLEGCSLIAIAGYASFVGQPLSKLARQLGTLLEGDATNGNER